MVLPTALEERFVEKADRNAKRPIKPGRMISERAAGAAENVLAIVVFYLFRLNRIQHSQQEQA